MTFSRFTDGRTDLIFDGLAEGHQASASDADGVSLIRWCDYYGDVSAIRFLLSQEETALHRAGVFGSRQAVQMLLDALANKEAKVQHGDSALGWASWYMRPAYILELLCYGDFHVNPAAVARSLDGGTHVWGNWMDRALDGVPRF